MQNQYTPPNQNPGPPPVKPLTLTEPQEPAVMRVLPFVAGGLALLALGGIGGAAIGHSTTNETACVKAVELSDQAIDIYSEAINEAANGVSAVASNNSYLMRQSTNKISDLTDELTPVLTEYYLAQDQCLNN